MEILTNHGCPTRALLIDLMMMMVMVMSME
jgi:hypothetical protein